MNWLKLLANKYVLCTVGAVLLFGAGYASGRWAVPAQVIVTEKIKEVEKQVVVTQTKTDVKIVKVSDAETIKKLHREISELTKPDGTKEKRTTEDLNVDAVVHTHEQDTKIVYVDKIIEKWHEKDSDKTSKTLRGPDWRVGAGVGVSIPVFLGQTEIGVPGMKGFVVQAEIDRRIIGPFYMGLFGNTQGVAGLNLSASF